MGDDASFTAFLCPSCNTEIEASLDMIGEETECPACGAGIKVPSSDSTSSGKVVRHGSECDAKSRTSAMKSRTIRIELGDI